MPKDLIDMVDEISREKGASRSSYISSVLRERILVERDRQIKEAYDRVFSDEAVRKEQLNTARWFLRSESREGQEW